MNDQEFERYSRQILLKEIGPGGQRKLANARVLVIGVGGLGSPALLYLAASGIGTIGLADGDSVDLTNLNRQILHFNDDVSIRKTDSAISKLQKFNPHIILKPYGIIDESNGDEIVSQYDFIIDGTDSVETKFLINDICVRNNKPFSHAGVLQFTGQILTVIPGKTACYRCIFARPPSEPALSCSEAGILGTVTGITGTLQATEAIKFITGAGSLLTDTLMVIDMLSMEFRKVPVRRDPECSMCGTGPTLSSPEAPKKCCQGWKTGG